MTAPEPVCKHVLATVRAEAGLNADEIVKRVGWWTPETISDALKQLVAGGMIVKDHAGHHRANFQ